MKYPKPVMKMVELQRMGFPRSMLMRAFKTKGQTFANRADPFRENTTIVFDTEGFEEWRKKQVRASQGGIS